MNKITLDTIVSQNNEKLLSSDLGDEVIMMNIENGDYLGLNEVGNAIWKSMIEPIKVIDICRALCKEFDVSQEVCEVSVLNFLGEMQTEQMLEIS